MISKKKLFGAKTNYELVPISPEFPDFGKILVPKIKIKSLKKRVKV